MTKSIYRNCGCAAVVAVVPVVVLAYALVPNEAVLGIAEGRVPHLGGAVPYYRLPPLRIHGSFEAEGIKRIESCAGARRQFVAGGCHRTLAALHDEALFRPAYREADALRQPSLAVLLAGQLDVPNTTPIEVLHLLGAPLNVYNILLAGCA